MSAPSVTDGRSAIGLVWVLRVAGAAVLTRDRRRA
jgi:hypothetical protein